MSDNYESSSRHFGDSSQFTNWILDSGATCHMTSQALDFIPGSFKDMENILKFQMDITSRHGKARSTSSNKNVL